MEKMRQPTSLFVAIALSSGNKAITRLPTGTSLIVERDFTGDRYTFILVDEEVVQSTTYHDISKEKLWKMLIQEGLTTSTLIWNPL